MRASPNVGEPSMNAFRPDIKVRYKADPSTVGWVISIAGESARVFINGVTKLVPMTELEPVPGLIEMAPDNFKTVLTQCRLEHPLTDQLLSYKASKTDLYYHQFLPVKKMLESPDQRLLIADEVGTGKTIEAGLIWIELESRAVQGLENAWVVCPKSLVGKWQEEMLQRFDLRLEIISPEGLRQALVLLERDGVLPNRFAKSVVNLELIRAEENLQRLSQTFISWDLVIFDEAHHLRNTDTLSHALASFMCERSKAALFLTATPLQTSLSDIVHLMDALGVDVAEDPSLLEEQIHWDMELNDWVRLVRRQPPGWQREADGILKRLERGGRDRPGWSAFRRLVADSDLFDRGQRTVAVSAARDLQVLSPYMTRTLRSDVDENRPIREAITRNVKFSPEEKSFYHKVYDICLERAKEKGAPPGFITQMPERRTASCVPAVVSEILRYASEDEDDEHRASFALNEIKALEPFARAALGSEDRKLGALLEILEHAFAELNADRAMIFSTFRGTLHYLAKALGERGYSYELMYGSTPARDEDCHRDEKSRERIAAEFRRGNFQLLLASEVAGEGLDFEHCHVLINYDFPWNPMRIEQRIGRCDRLGQRSNKIYVGSLASLGTIEQRILSRLYTRLGVFEQALGDMEVILGEAVASFERDVFTRHLSSRQQEERLEKISQAIENREQQRESVTQSEVISLQGRQLIESDQEEIKEAESRFLSSVELAEFILTVLARHFPDSVKTTTDGGKFEVINNEGIHDALQKLITAYPATHQGRVKIVRFCNRLHQQRRLRCSFVGEAEREEFVHARHPLMLLARHLERGRLFDTPWCSSEVPSGILDRPTLLAWAIGSLEGYANRAELLCASVDLATEKVKSIPVELGQKFLQAMTPATGDHTGSNFDLEALKILLEKALLSEFKGMAKVFFERDELLAEKAKRAVYSHARRQLTRNERQLAKDDLNTNLRNMYLGWNRRIKTEMESKLTEIEIRSRTRSSLEIIGMAVLAPQNLGVGYRAK